MAKKPPKPTDRPPSPRHKGKTKGARPPASNFMTQQWKNRPEFKSVLVEIRTQNDRGAAITAGAAVEHSLRLAIEARWSPSSPMSDTARKCIFGETGPLGTFAAKIKVAHALGFVDQQTADYLNTVRLIRNEFAHHMKPITFASEIILALCKNLPNPDFFANGAQFVPPMDDERMRSIFIEKVYDLMLFLIGDLETVDASPDKSA
jgi:DNA-binding MltR family transcriptional regulator